jgi:hypothetical protein
MKKPAIALLWPCLCSVASAATVSIGGIPVDYVPPAGFVQAKIPIKLDVVENKSESNTVIFAQFIPENDPYRRDASAVPSWYIHMAYDLNLEGQSLSKPVFLMIAGAVEAVLFHRYGKRDFIHKLETVISGAIQRKLTLDAMKSEGVVENRAGVRSTLAYGLGSLETDTGPEAFHLATMTTFYLAKGKFIVILQAQRIESKEKLPAFHKKALRIAAEIRGAE